MVDESFVDTDPDLSLLQRLKQSVEAQNVIVLRSFGKFYGLAGVRLGFALGSEHLVDRLRGRAGPWPVSGPALACGLAALADARWRDATVARLRRDAKRLDALAASAGWTLVGGTALFRTYDTGDAAAAQNRLARGHVWSRIFPYSVSWLRLGLAGSAQEWNRLGEIFSDLGKDRL